MKFFKAIGAFFARIGRWIRDTAWVQPLLIVGGIFGIIFSIPYLTKWVKSWFEEGDVATTYYKKNDATWDKVSKEESEVDKLFKYIMNYTSADVAKKDYKTEYKKYGEKFFINFVKEDCTECTSNYYGFKTLQKNWGKGEFAFEGEKESFKMVNIFIDETNDDDEFLFQKYICGVKDEARYSELFDSASELESYYLQENYTTETVKSTMFNEEGTFQAPCTFLIDFNFDGYDNEVYGISEIFFNYSGKDGKDTNFGKARTLWDCWNHVGAFSEDAND